MVNKEFWVISQEIHLKGSLKQHHILMEKFLIINKVTP